MRDGLGDVEDVGAPAWGPFPAEALAAGADGGGCSLSRYCSVQMKGVLPAPISK
jgi:hypothetical protein